MNGQDDRASRKYQPEIESHLERRDVPTSFGNFNPIAFLGSKLMPPHQTAKPNAAIQATDWTSVEGWSWLKGNWKSKTSIDIMKPLMAALGGKNAGGNIPAIPSVDTWNLSINSYIGKSALASAQNTEMPVDGIIIRPGATPTFAMTSADGTEPVELKMVSSTKNSITFQGLSQHYTSQTDASGNALTNNVSADPVQVTITRRSPNTMRITAEVKMMNQSWVRLFRYTATKVNSNV